MKFDCGGGMWIKMKKVCEKKKDCNKWEDEKGERWGKDEWKEKKGGW